MNAGGPNNIKGAQYVVAAMSTAMLSLSVLVKASNAVVPPAFYNDETNQNITVVNYLNEEQQIQNFAPIQNGIWVIVEWSDGETCNQFTSSCTGPDGTNISLLSTLPSTMACGASFSHYALAGAFSAFYNNETTANISYVDTDNSENIAFDAFAGFDSSWLTDVYCPGYTGL